MKRGISIVLLLLESLLFSLGQTTDKKGGKWDGDFTLLLGGNFKPREMSMDDSDEKIWSNYRISGKAKLGYRTKDYFVELLGNSSCSVVYNTSEVFTWKLGADSTYNYELITKENIVTGVTCGLNGGWNIDTRNEIKMNYKYTYGFVNASNFKGNVKSAIEESIDMAYEEINNFTQVHDAGVSYRRAITPDDKEVSANMSVRFRKGENSSEWDVFTDFGDTEKQYKITPYSYTNSYNISGKYGDKEMFNVKGFDADFSLACQFNDNMEYQRAATYYGEVWYDSVKYRDDFRFQEITVSPKIHLFYKKKIHILDFSYIPQFYIRRLSSITQQGDFSNGNISNLFNMSYTITPWKYSRFEFSLSRNVSRPNYLQTCWFKRTGQQDNHLIYQGDPSLEPSSTYQGKISYTFGKSGFYLTPSLTYTYGSKIIEQTYYNDTIDGEQYRVFTWINSGENHTTNGSIKFGYGYKGFKTEVGGSLKYFHGIRHNGGNTYSSDYSVYANASYENKGWKVSAKGYYQSAVKRNYTSITDIIGLDVHLEKKIGKFTILLDGFNLLDRRIDILTLSSDESEGRGETQYNNRRIFQIGVNFTF